METREFNFGDGSVATAYDDMLVPILFKPWARRLADDHQPWDNLHVLDLATGTGIVAQTLAHRVGPRGKVYGADINKEMLEVAKKRCHDQLRTVEFLECPADRLDLNDASMDVVVCQQGFQFFPDRVKAAGEILRVLRAGGRLVASTWRPVAECEFFGSICTALSAIGKAEIGEMMRLPFDALSESELASDLRKAGFVDVHVGRDYSDLVMDGGIEHAVSVAYSTPIGPKLRGLSSVEQAKFKEALAADLERISKDGTTMGTMVSNVFTARKLG